TLCGPAGVRPVACKRAKLPERERPRYFLAMLARAARLQHSPKDHARGDSTAPDRRRSRGGTLSVQPRYHGRFCRPAGQRESMVERRWARRIGEIEPFHVMAVLDRAKALQAAGHDVIHMEIGEPDFGTPEPIMRAAQAALNAGHTSYTPALGLPELREAIAGCCQRRYGVDLGPQRVIITPGGSGALLLVSALLVDAGSKVLMADPAYPCNRHFMRLVEGAAKLIPPGPESAYQLTPELIEQHWDADSVAVLSASPANPSGSVLSRAQLQGLAQVTAGLGGELIVDEIYHGLTYGCDAASVL